MRNRVIVVASWVGRGLISMGLMACTSTERTFDPPTGKNEAGSPRPDAAIDDAASPIVITDPTESSVGGSSTQATERTTSVDPSSGGGTEARDAGGSSGPDPITMSHADSSTSEGATSESDTDTDTDTDAGGSCVPVLEVEGNCADNADDDCDGKLDCEDSECSEALECQVACVPSGLSETQCSDIKDDDCDGFLDCDDIDCVSAGNCKTDCVPTPELCADTLDNDCNGFSDCLDASCSATAACCTPSGEEVCGDGIDNDCDGVLDCPVIIEAVPTMPAADRAPWEGGAVSADRAALTLEMPASEHYIVQCRSGKPGNVQSKQFGVCNPLDPTALTVHPLSAADATKPIFNGVVTTQVRFAYPNGQASKPAAYTYYVHNSLVDVPECAEKASDADYFRAAVPYLVSGREPTFQNKDARLAAPFVNIAFTPSPSTVFEVQEGEGHAEYLSLRRRFVLNPESNLVLMKRVYASRRTTEGACLAATLRKHAADPGPIDSVKDNTRYFREGCDAVVLNRQGAGVCLRVNEGAIEIANPNSARWQLFNFETYNWVDWGGADNFMWRKLKRPSNAEAPRQMFSPKCYEGGASCATGKPDTLFLPDRDLYDL